jgi:hypothetical protein
VKILGAYNQTQNEKIQEAILSQANGCFYHWTRHFVLSSSDQRIYDVTLNFLERIKKFFFELIGGDYFNAQATFKGKKVSILHEKLAGLPVRPSGSIPVPLKAHEMGDDEAYTIITRHLNVHGASISLIQSLADPLFSRYSTIGSGLERTLSLDALIREPPFQGHSITLLKAALMYLLLQRKIGFYQQKRAESYTVSLDPTIGAPQEGSTVALAVTRDQLIGKKA